MNHGIKVIRHKSGATLPARGKSHPGHIFCHHADAAKTDEELVAEILCARLHDDEATVRITTQCRFVHVLPPGTTPGGPGPPMLDPDPQCVAKRTAYLKRWKGKAEPALVCSDKD